MISTQQHVCDAAEGKTECRKREIKVIVVVIVKSIIVKSALLRGSPAKKGDKKVKVRVKALGQKVALVIVNTCVKCDGATLNCLEVMTNVNIFIEFLSET